MAVANVTVLLPVQDETQSVEKIEVTKTQVTSASDGVVIADALGNKNNSLQIYIENGTTSGGSAADSSALIKAGNNYPNAILGDLPIALGAGKITVVLLEDISRFENRDNTVKITFGSGFSGNVWAVAKRAGIKPVPTT